MPKPTQPDGHRAWPSSSRPWISLHRSSGGQASDQRKVDLLILVKTSAWLLSDRERPAFRVAETVGTERAGDPGAPVRGLLGAILDESIPGGAWLSRVAAEPQAYVSAGAEMSAMVDDLTTAVRHAWAEARARTFSASRDPVLSRKLSRLRHRMFLDADRFEAALPDLGCAEELAGMRRDGLHYYVVLDLKFRYLLSQLRCHVSTAVWSGIPEHPEHRPDGLGRSTPLPGGLDVDRHHRGFSKVAEAADEMLIRHGFVPADGTIGDGAHGLPVFWIVTPSQTSRRPIDHLTEGTPYCEFTNRLARTFLNVGDIRDSVVSHSVLNGHLVTLRRPEDGPDGVRVPRYLMIPAGYPPARQARLRTAERDIAGIIMKLTDLEAEGASRILAAKADLDIWHNHLRVYNVVGERAVFLWDALSTHLPIRRHAKLGRAHRAVELMHQFLLQALGDLGHIAALIRQATADITDAAGDVSDAFHAVITERPLAPETGVCAALTETGWFGHTRREAGEVATEADRVKQAYDDLLQSITQAFEERRVRESEVMQKYGIGFGIFLGAGVIVEALDATLKMEAPAWFLGTETASQIASGVSWVIALMLGLLLVRGSVLFQQIGKLGSRRFRRVYDGRRGHAFLRRRFFWPYRKKESDDSLRRPTYGLWQVMKDISTARLESIGDIDWEQLDRRLAEEYAAIWDAVTEMGMADRSDAAGRDIKALSGQVEQWGMRSLLLTERARRMYRYQLPNLTCLFRCCAQIEGSFLRHGYLTGTNMVATEDLDRSLSRLGFKGPELRLIDNWLTAPVYPSAAEALRRIGGLHLKPTMSYSERQRVLCMTSGEDRPIHIPAPRESTETPAPDPDEGTLDDPVTGQSPS